jgi:hypothetical protein
MKAQADDGQSGQDDRETLTNPEAICGVEAGFHDLLDAPSQGGTERAHANTDGPLGDGRRPSLGQPQQAERVKLRIIAVPDDGSITRLLTGLF